MDATISGIEQELTLLARHNLHNGPRAGMALDRSGYSILTRLAQQPGMTLAELAEAFGLDISTVNRQVARLRERSYVERVLDPGGGAARRLSPTREGLKALRSDRRAIQAGIERVLDGWSNQDRERLRALLTRFNEDVERLEGRPWPRD